MPRRRCDAAGALWCSAAFVSARREVRIFPQRTMREIIAVMMVRRQLNRQVVLTLLVIGLVLGPFLAVPAMAARAHDAMSAMAGSMPCRPLDRTSVPDPQMVCPLIAVCMANCLPGAPVLGAAAPGAGTKGVAIGPGIDALRSPLREQPPSRPPRT